MPAAITATATFCRRMLPRFSGVRKCGDRVAKNDIRLPPIPSPWDREFSVWVILGPESMMDRLAEHRVTARVRMREGVTPESPRVTASSITSFGIAFLTGST